jgi:carbonic anhydrase
MDSKIEELFINGNLQFQRKILQELESSEPEGKVPKFPVLILTCMDPRIDVHRIFQLNPGDVFVLRNAGNLFSQDTFRSLLLAIYQYRIKYVIILGHLDCGMTKINLIDLKRKTPHEFLPHSSRNSSDLFSETRIFFKPFMDEIRNIEKQIENFQNLQQYIPELEIIGMLFDTKTGWVFNYNDFNEFAYVENFEKQQEVILRKKKYQLNVFLKSLESENSNVHKIRKLQIKEQLNQEEEEKTDKVMSKEIEEIAKNKNEKDDRKQSPNINSIMPKIQIPKITFPGVKIYIPRIFFKKKISVNLSIK